MGRELNVAVVGATGAVGTTMVRILEERNFPIANLKLLASSRSAGEVIEFRNEQLVVEKLTHNSFSDIDLVLSSAGGSVSREFMPSAVEAGAVVIDNTSAFRMDDEVPLVIPEVNMHATLRHKGLIANPNCSTIQMLVALKPIYDTVGIKRIVASTYQSVSGKGGASIVELVDQTSAALEGKKIETKVFPHQMAFNVAFDWPFLENGDTEEESKMIAETHKILGDDSIGVSVTTVRVPVFYAHSEAINIETKRKISVGEVRKILSEAPGIVVTDDVRSRKYPLATEVSGSDEVHVGRIREDRSIENGLNLWVVADNLRKGAALNAIQIAEILNSSEV